MKPHHTRLLANYGPEAVILGASEGIGRAFAEELAAAGFSLLLVARRPGPLQAAAASISDRYGVEVRTLEADLSEPGIWKRIRDAAGDSAGDADSDATGDTRLGLVIYNAAASPIGPLLDLELETVARTVSVNIATPLEVLHGAGNAMRRRFADSGHRGGVILLSSLSALRGTPYISAYAASKAWAMVLAEGVGQETAAEGVDVLACVAGATDTPGYRDSLTAGSVAPVQSPEAVAREALTALGRRNLIITGRMNRLIAALVYGMMPRKWGTAILSRAAASLRRRDDVGLNRTDS